MRIHEHQAKKLFAEYGIPVAASRIASTADEAVSSANPLGFRVVVKAQIHAGGRGKGGGIQFAKDESEVCEAATRMLGMALVAPCMSLAGQAWTRVE